ncbi:MAG TPA: PAS domain S-box protein [Candidatus Acidoferrales bacterium]|nr:PAS domain S-box protein [Candidatus Acidoferrales bacterium]
MPHGFCYFWNPGLVWLHVISDSLIALAYFAIPVILVWFVRKRRDIPFSWMFVLFGVFIVACGGTHLMEVWNIWHANYWVDGLIKAVTAAASVPTAILLAEMMPRALTLPNIDQWIQANAQLEKEVRERRDIELQLRTSEAVYREQAELLDLTDDAIFIRDMEDKIVFWNRGAERLYGWRADEVRGKIARTILQKRFPQPLAQIEAEVSERGSWEGELIHRSRIGSEIIVSSRWMLRRDPAGNPTAILESNRDITRRATQEQMFRTLLESAPDAMVIVNDVGRIQMINAQTEKLFGYSREELIGQPVERLMPDRFRSQHIHHRQGYSQSPRTRAMGVGLDLYGQRKNGTEFPIEISLSPIETVGGTLVASAIRDVTDRRLAEEALESNRNALAQSNGQLIAANKELEAFSYSVSHDLRAPVRHIDGFARLLSETYGEQMPQQVRHYLERIIAAAEHMGRLVDSLLNLARIGRKELIRQEAVSLGDLVRRAVSDFSSETEERGIEWRIQALPVVTCDPGLLTLVFSNLLSNALKFTRAVKHPVIQVGTQVNGARATIFVRDNGVGFDSRYADKLFGVFQRLHREEDFEGTGIGLATVQRIIQRHGGEVWAESTPGQATTFYFTLEPRFQRTAPNAVKEASLEQA